MITQEIKEPSEYLGPDPARWKDVTYALYVAAERDDGHKDVFQGGGSFRIKGEESDQTVSHKPILNRLNAEGGLMAKYPVILTREETGAYTVECPFIPNCFSEGKTEEEAIANIKTVIRDLLEIREELHIPPTYEVRYVEV